MKKQLSRLLSSTALLAAFLAIPAAGADISTYSFAGCAFPGTNQSVSYTATFGEDHDYASTASTMSFTVYNPIGISSVTVDNRTGLMWLTDPRTDAGFKGPQTWESALTSCTVTLNGMAYAGYTDWRLPNVRELMSIVDYSKSLPRINTTAFPNTVSGIYWTSTTYVPGPASAWYGGFSSGSVNITSKTGNNYVRCVRGGP